MNSIKEEVIRHWLLDLSVDLRLPLKLVLPRVESESLNVKPIPHCLPEDYAKGFLKLIEEGAISLSSAHPGDNVETVAGVRDIIDRFLGLPPDYSAVRRLHRADLNDPVVRRLPRSDLEVTFELTPLGGDLWEKTAEPEWNRFFIEFHGSKTGEVASQNLNLLMARIGWFQELSEARILPNTIRVKKHSEYPILYWKRLPNVYRAEFLLEPAQARWHHGLNGEPEWFREWRGSTVDWYRHPWDLPTWPREHNPLVKQA